MMKAIALMICAFVAVGFAESSLGLDDESRGSIPYVDDISAPIQHRFQRSPEPQGSLSGTFSKPFGGPERRPTYNFDYNHRLVNRKDGNIDLSVGGQKLPGRRVEPTVGLSGTFRFRRSPEPQGSLSGTFSKPFGGPERRPTYNFDYNHRLVNRKDGNIDLSVGGQKLPGRRVEPTVGLSGTLRFRRSPEPQGSLSGTFSKPFGGPERRPTYNFDYNHRLVNRKDGNIDLSVGGQKLPGRRVEPTVGLSGTLRFRRSPEPQGSLSGTFSKPFGGPERRPTYNFDYNHRLVNRKDGNIDLSVGGQKLPGRRVEPTVGLSGTLRFRRSPEPQGSLSGTYVKPLDGPERRPTYNFDYNHRLVNRKDGNIDLSVGGQKLPGRRVEPTVGLSGTLRFRRSPEPQGSLSGTFSKPFGGPERRPTYNFDYNHRLVNRKDGNIDLSVGGQKLPGRRVEPTVGLSGTFRFRRSPEPQGSLSGTFSKPFGGPERRPTYNFDYNHRLVNRKDGNIDLSVGGQKLPGRRVEPTVGLSGTFRFRRSPEPQGSLSGTYVKPLDGPERRPTYNFDYNHRLVNRKDGNIDLSVGGQKLPGRRVEPTVGLSGTFRFRRSPEPQGSLSGTFSKPFGGPERRPTYNFDYNHRLVNRKDGNIDLSVGGQKLPGRRVEPTVGLSGTFRFRRSPEPQGSLSGTYVKPLDGPERRPTYNFDYNHRLVNRKDGNIDLSVGGQKLPGRRVEPTVGLSSTFRFRRSFDSEN